MKKLLFMILIFFITVAFQACWLGTNVTKPYRENAFSDCYSGNYTGYDTLIKLKGYYTSMVINHRTHDSYYDKNPNEFNPFPDIDTGTTLMMFFDDGICVFGLSDCFIQDDFLLKVITNHAQQNYFEKSSCWGIYDINQDTLSLACMNYTTFGDPERILKKFTYLIQNNQTLKLLNEKFYIQSGSQIDIKEFNYQNIRYRVNNLDTTFYYPAHFVPLINLPNSDCWLKKNKWFWCDEEKYKEYMLRSKER